MPGSFRIAKIAGIAIEINVSWLIILVFLTVSLATTWFPTSVRNQSSGVYWLTGFFAALLFFGSVLAHELGHSLLARARGLPVHSITLFIFGGVSDLEQEPRSAGMEFQIAAIGPVVSIVIGVVAWLIGHAIGNSASLVAAVLLFLGFENVALGIFNLIPGFPLDGGRVLRSLLWGSTGNLRQATQWASLIGEGIAILFILVGIWQFFQGNVFGGIWIGFIGWFLLSAAQAANAHGMLEAAFRGVRVSEVMAPASFSVPAGMSIQQFVDGYLLPYGLRAVPVTQGDHLTGLITQSDVRRVPREQWPNAPVGHAMVPLERLHAALPDQLLSDVMTRMAQLDINQMPVTENGRLVGILSRDAIVRFLEIRRGMRPRDAVRSVDQALPLHTRTPNTVNTLS